MNPKRLNTPFPQLSQFRWEWGLGVVPSVDFRKCLSHVSVDHLFRSSKAFPMSHFIKIQGKLTVYPFMTQYGMIQFPLKS